MMQWTRRWGGVIVPVVASVSNAQPAKPVEQALTAPALLRVTNLTTGQSIEAPGEWSWPRGGTVVVFDTMTNEQSTTGLNVAYVDPASYTGGSSSTQAFAVSMAERLVYRAPSDPESGFPLPTDIAWNDYASDLSRWPGGAGGAAQALESFGVIPYFQNTEPPLAARNHTLRVRFFSADRRIDHGGFAVVYRVNPGQTGYFGATIDVSGFDPPIRVPASGWVMLDWAEPNNSGVGCMFTGGDLSNPAYPRPETLWEVGTTLADEWWFSDGVTGEGGPPNEVDPAWDGDPTTVSYLDVVNTGATANWQFTAGSPPTTFLAHDFACRLIIGGGPVCRCDVDGSGVLNSQDFFDFIVGFFAGQGDFNGSGATDSQDFFDFLVCFFGGC
jgi:hypothetical protein